MNFSKVSILCDHRLLYVLRTKAQGFFRGTLRRLELNDILSQDRIREFMQDAITLYFSSVVLLLTPHDGYLRCRGQFDGSACASLPHGLNLVMMSRAETSRGLPGQPREGFLGNLELDHSAKGIGVLADDWRKQIRSSEEWYPREDERHWRATHSDPDLLLHSLFSVEPAVLHSGWSPAGVTLRCHKCHNTCTYARDLGASNLDSAHA